MIRGSDFKPAWWLPGPHLQTIWPVIAGRRFNTTVQRERLELGDGDFLDLDWVGSQPNSPIVIVLHGLGGSVQSPYIRGILETIDGHGWRGVLVHFRGCSGEHNRLARGYHSGDTADVAYVIEQIRRREPNVPLAAVGYSLGGNVLLKWLGESAADNPLQCAMAVSVPFELHKAADHISMGVSRFYQWWLLRQIRSEMLLKFNDIESPPEMGDINAYDNFWQFDDKITAPLHGFRSAHDYYSQTSARQFLKTIKVPTLILHSMDDPFMSKEIIPEVNRL